MRETDHGFWERLSQFVRLSEIKIDRPRGTSHPRHPDWNYPLDYGYLAGMHSVDGEGLDIWVGDSGEMELTGLVCSVDLEKGDAEMKILLGCSRQEMETIVSFHNHGEQSAILVCQP